MNFNVIFPMAGESKRFNYQFKPFLQISDLTFIELAYKYFKDYEEKINHLYFIITKQQEDEYKIKGRLSQLFTNFSVIIISEKTSGPFMTIKSAINHSKIDINIPSFICDCDHSINIKPIINYINQNDNYKILISCWDIRKNDENYQDWGIVYKNNKGQIIDFSEKVLINDHDNYFGIIGCYFFKNLSYFIDHSYQNITDGLKTYIKEIKSVTITQAEFFGDMRRFDKAIQNRKKISTIFCDIDGTIIKHEKNPDNLTIDVFNESIKKLYEWKKNNHRIILTTARSKKNDLIKLLLKYKIPYDDLLCGLPSGTRILINDYKDDLLEMCKSYNVKRNKGIDDINFENNEFQIVKILKGNSFSKTVLLSSKKKQFVRKYILKNNDNLRHYHKLKRQYYDLNRLNSYCNSLCPIVFNETDLDYIYYFDIEYLKDYHNLNYQKGKTIQLYHLLEILNREVYTAKKINNNDNYIYKLLEKVKIKEYCNLDPVINDILKMDKIIINNKEYLGLEAVIQKIDIKIYNPHYLSVIHGDLTFENIMVCKNDIKLIDPDGSDYIDAIELDFGKLLQSYLSNYEVWSDITNVDKLVKNIIIADNIINTYEYKNEIDSKFYQTCGILLNDGNINFVKRKSIFYMCIHLLRMIPYRYNNNLNSTIYCIKECIVWLNSII